MKSYLTQNGFTLIELLISIAIIVILTSIGIASFNSSSSKNGVQQRAAEIRSLARKLRTDAGSAIKPITGATPATSCKSPDPAQADQGTAYGTYINFTNNSQNYAYGVACFDSSNVWRGSATAATLPTGFKFVISSYPTIIFPFNGLAGSITPAQPAVGDFTTVVMNPTDPRYVQITDTDNTNNYYVYFSSTGLVCEQKTTSAPVCAS